MIGPGSHLKIHSVSPQDFEEIPFTIDDVSTFENIDDNVYPLVLVTGSVGYNGLVITDPFTFENHANKYLSIRDPFPFVGNLKCGHVMGLSVASCATLTPAVRGTSEVGVYYDPPMYWGKPGTVPRPPRTVLVRLPSLGDGMLEVIWDELMTIQDQLEEERIQVIFDTGDSGYCAFSYGAPHRGWNPPQPKTEMHQFEGGEFLTIYFTGNPWGPSRGYSIIEADTGVYVFTINSATSVGSAGESRDYFEEYVGPPIPITDPQPADLTFLHIDASGVAPADVPGTDPTADAAYWLSLSDRYYRRKYVMHNTEFPGIDPDASFQGTANIVGTGSSVWGPNIDGTFWEDGAGGDTRVLTQTFSSSSTPSGLPEGGAAYFYSYAVSGQFLGRDVVDERTPPDGPMEESAALDIAAAIIEDITDFFSL